ncbi:MAG: chorismate mutase [Oscillospiraceae bacterium]|nr:chorismate mutase [Oscillospiraceae bacterium]
MLNEIRKEIDMIDDEICRLFAERMKLSAKVGDYKREHNLPVLNAARESEIIARLTENQPAGFAENIKTLFNVIFKMSQAEQK